MLKCIEQNQDIYIRKIKDFPNLEVAKGAISRMLFYANRHCVENVLGFTRCKRNCNSIENKRQEVRRRADAGEKTYCFEDTS